MGSVKTILLRHMRTAIARATWEDTICADKYFFSERQFRSGKNGGGQSDYPRFQKETIKSVLIMNDN